MVTTFVNTYKASMGNHNFLFPQPSYLPYLLHFYRIQVLIGSVTELPQFPIDQDYWT